MLHAAGADRETIRALECLSLFEKLSPDDNPGDFDDIAYKGVATPFHGQRIRTSETENSKPAKPSKPKTASKTQIQTANPKNQQTANPDPKAKHGNIEVRPLKTPSKRVATYYPFNLGARPHRWKSKRWNGTISQRSSLDLRL